MPSNNVGKVVVATVVTVGAAVSLGVLYWLCPEAIPDTVVVEKTGPSHTVVVQQPVSPVPIAPPDQQRPGIPAYAVPVNSLPWNPGFHVPSLQYSVRIAPAVTIHHQPSQSEVYSISVNTPYRVVYKQPCAIWLPRGYKQRYVYFNNLPCQIVCQNNLYYYVYNNCAYPVYFV